MKKRHYTQHQFWIMFLCIGLIGPISPIDAADADSAAEKKLLITIGDMLFEPGMRWAYSVGDTSTISPSNRLIRQIENKVSKDENAFFEEISFSSGAGIARLYYCTLPSSLAVYQSTDAPEPLYTIPFPLYVGTSFKFTLPMLGPVPLSVTVVAQEQVTVPYGTFECLKLIIDTGAIPQIQEFNQWMSPQVGMVKQQIVMGKRVQVMELSAFHKNADSIWKTISPPSYASIFDTLSPDWKIFSGGWNVSNGILSSRGQGNEYIWLAPYVWNDCTISYRFKIVSGNDAWLSLRANMMGPAASGFSYLQIDGGTLKFRHTGQGTFRDISPHIPAPPSNQWHSVKCILEGSHGDCYIDGNLAVSTDECPAKFGMVGFRALNTKIEIDDLTIEKLSPNASEQKAAVNEGLSRIASTQAFEPGAPGEEEYLTRDYFPIGTSHEWVFQVTRNGNVTEETRRFTSVGTTREGKTFWILATGNSTASGYLSEKGLQVERTDGFSFSPPTLYFRDVITPGEIVSSRTHLAGPGISLQLITYCKIEGLETIETPAGTFENCIRFSFYMNPEGKLDGLGNLRLRSWLAKGIGAVKVQDFAGGGNEVLQKEIILKHYKAPGK